MGKESVNTSQTISDNTETKMRLILFFVITGFFIIITTLTILAVFTNLVDPGQQYQDTLFYTFLVEIGGAIIALFYSLNNLKSSANKKATDKTYDKISDATDDLMDEIDESRARLRTNVDISGLKGQWSATWFLEGKEEPYVEDNIWIEEIKGNEIHGKGVDKKGTYEFEGLYFRGVLALVYKYIEEGYSMAGVIVLKVGPLSKSAKGKWYGYLAEDEINGGEVVWKQI